MRRALVVSAAAAALAFAAPAAAKYPIRAEICGVSACTTVTDKASLVMLPAGENARALGAAAPYYRIEVVSAEEGNRTFSWFVYYVPSANAMAWGESGVIRLHPIYGAPTTRLMRKLVRRVRPFPVPHVTSALVGSRRVEGAAAQSYLGLFEQGEQAPLAESPDDWVAIDLRSTTKSPWTDGRPDLMYAPSENLLELGYTRVELPGGLAADIEAGRALDGATSRRPWAWLLAPLALAVLALLALRLRRGAAARPPLPTS